MLYHIDLLCDPSSHSVSNMRLQWVQASNLKEKFW